MRTVSKRVRVNKNVLSHIYFDRILVEFCNEFLIHENARKQYKFIQTNIGFEFEFNFQYHNTV